MTDIWTAIHGAWALLKAEGIKAQLVGTAGLVALGYDVPAADVDFLCESMPTGGDTLPLDPEYKQEDTSRTLDIGGVRVNFIMSGDARAPFLSPEPEIEAGVPVAPLRYILALKRRADRPKDRDFFAAHPYFAACIKDI